MKFTIDIKSTTDALKKCSAAQTGRQTLPILSCIKLEADGDGLRLTSTDLDRFVSCKVPAEVVKPGSIAISGKMLSGILSGSGTATFEVDSKHKAVIRCGSSKFRISGLAASEMPELISVKNPETFQITSEEWLRASSAVKWAAFVGQGRDTLVGTLLTSNEDGLVLVATDGRCLSKTAAECEGSFSGEAIIPTESMAMLDALASGDGMMTVHIGGGVLSAELGGDVVVTKLIEGYYPNWRQVVPNYGKDDVTRLDVGAKAILEAIGRVSVVASDKACSANLESNGATLTISMGHEDNASAEFGVEIEGPPVKIKLNPRLLSNPFRYWNADVLKVEVRDEMSPAVVTHERNLFVVMPMRITQ